MKSEYYCILIQDNYYARRGFVARMQYCCFNLIIFCLCCKILSRNVRHPSNNTRGSLNPESWNLTWTIHTFHTRRSCASRLGSGYWYMRNQHFYGTFDERKTKKWTKTTTNNRYFQCLLVISTCLLWANVMGLHGVVSEWPGVECWHPNQNLSSCIKPLDLGLFAVCVCVGMFDVYIPNVIWKSSPATLLCRGIQRVAINWKREGGVV